MSQKKFLDTLITLIWQRYLTDQKNTINRTHGNQHEAQIAEIERQIVYEACNITSDETIELNSESGGYNPGHIWRLKEKIIPRPPQVPTTMKVADGSLLISNDDLKKETFDHYSCAQEQIN